jgi:hypothetical protein
MMAWLIENWRDAILMVAGLIALYMVFSIMRLVQMSRSHHADNYAERADLPRHDLSPDSDVAAAPATAPVERASVAPSDAQRSESLRDELMPPAATDAHTTPPLGAAARFARFAGFGAHESAEQPVSQIGASSAPERFADELRQSHMEAEIDQLRRQSENLREELKAVHAELAQLRAARNVSPMYSEAASLAQRGVSADGIAGQLGISLGEAELVAALARADDRSGRVEPTAYHDPHDTLDRDDPNAAGGSTHGGQSLRHRRTGTHG